MRISVHLLWGGLAACTAGPVPDDAFHREAIAFLDALQPTSIAENREYCGYFAIDDDGAFVATTPERGRADYCEITNWPEDATPVASYHTHSAFDTEADSEVPSTDDLRSDIAERVYGYVSTPGGRVWFVDWQDRTARQLCGIGCVASDPAFIAGDAGPISQSYSLRQLRSREEY